jgi:nucleoside-diphosphate-sugar epimerase
MAGTGIPDPCLLSLGHGYSARALAARLAASGAGWRLLGTTRDPARAAAMRAEGVAPVLWENRVAVDEAIDAATHLLVSLPPEPEGCPALARHREAIGRSRRLGWIGYLSTTGVYGDHGGDWVDESVRPAPVNDRSRRRVEAEAAWAALGAQSDRPVQIFRLAGIYGPGRSPFERLRAGTAQRVVKPGQVFSRIHVDDIARVLEASMAAPARGAIYNVADDAPAPPGDVIAHAAALLGIDPPPEVPFEAAGLSPMARSFWAESKRVSNARIKRELGVRLAYPDYRSGLAAILAAER